MKSPGPPPMSVDPLRPSLFPNVPPYIKFIPADGSSQYKKGIPDSFREILWQVPCTIWYTVTDCATLAGFSVVETRIRQSEDSLGSGAIWDTLPITEKASDAINFKGICGSAKINQFPGLFQLGRKDLLWQNHEGMRKKYGSKEFDYLPRTFCLPDEKRKLKKLMKKKTGCFWIVKPPNLYCGIGIRVINSLQALPDKKSRMCVQKYLKEPFLINGLKFDLRIYVLLTSVDPLRVYIYEEGLVRFATEEYTTDPNKITNNYVHLTNYSINKESENFVQNENPMGCEGSKWTLTSLWRHFSSSGIDHVPIWEKVKDIVIKSLLSVQTCLSSEFNDSVRSHYNCYKMLGYDIFLDSLLRPHLIEINTIPSLAALPNTIDSFVKQPLVAEMFNIVGFHVPQQVATKHQQRILSHTSCSNMKPLGHDKRMYSKDLTDEDLRKMEDYNNTGREEYIENILDDLSPYDVKQLIRHEDENSQTEIFRRIWPTNQSHKYFRFLDKIPYNEKLLDAYESYYFADRDSGLDYLREYCERKIHLKTKPETNNLVRLKRAPNIEIPNKFLIAQ